MGFAFWLLVEMFTPPGRGMLDLLARFVPAFVIGMFVGGIFGLLFHFGRYVLLPIYYGNQAAIFDGIAIIVFVFFTLAQPQSCKYVQNRYILHLPCDKEHY